MKLLIGWKKLHFSFFYFKMKYTLQYYIWFLFTKSFSTVEIYIYYVCVSISVYEYLRLYICLVTQLETKLLKISMLMMKIKIKKLLHWNFFSCIDNWNFLNKTYKKLNMKLNCRKCNNIKNRHENKINDISTCSKSANQ